MANLGQIAPIRLLLHNPAPVNGGPRIVFIKKNTTYRQSKGYSLGSHASTLDEPRQWRRNLIWNGGAGVAILTVYRALCAPSQ